MSTRQLIIYRDFQYQRLLDDMVLLLDRDENACDGTTPDSSSCANQLIELATVYGFEGNLRHRLLVLCVVNHENAYSTTYEVQGAADGTLSNLALQDLRTLKQIFDYDITTLGRFTNDNELWNYLAVYKAVDGGAGKVFSKRIHDRIIKLPLSLAKAENAEEFQDTTMEFYKGFGVGKFGLNEAFRTVEEKGKAYTKPIVNVEHIYLDDTIGYELQKQKLIANTESFIQGEAANNVLPFGDVGTGRSSDTKAVSNEYYNQDLRITEVYKHQFHTLSSVLEQIQDRNCRFIIYMDDLFFEESELEYRYLKAIIKDDLGCKSKDVLIYTISNCRYLTREKSSDKRELDDEFHVNDAVQEKLSLVARFGATIYSGTPDKREFRNIAKLLAEKYHVEMSVEELYAEANKQELDHDGLSGRMVAQFITHLLRLPESYGRTILHRFHMYSIQLWFDCDTLIANYLL